MSLLAYLSLLGVRMLVWRADLAARRANHLFLAGDRAQDEAEALLARARVTIAAHLSA